MLGQRHRRWANIKAIWGQLLCLLGVHMSRLGRLIAKSRTFYSKQSRIADAILVFVGSMDPGIIVVVLRHT